MNICCHWRESQMSSKRPSTICGLRRDLLRCRTCEWDFTEKTGGERGEWGSIQTCVGWRFASLLLTGRHSVHACRCERHPVQSYRCANAWQSQERRPPEPVPPQAMRVWHDRRSFTVLQASFMQQDELSALLNLAVLRHDSGCKQMKCPAGLLLRAN